MLLIAATAVSPWQVVRATQAEARQALLRAKAEADEQRARETAEQNERLATVMSGIGSGSVRGRFGVGPQQLAD